MSVLHICGPHCIAFSQKRKKNKLKQPVFRRGLVLVHFSGIILIFLPIGTSQPSNMDKCKASLAFLGTLRQTSRPSLISPWSASDLKNEKSYL